MKEIYDFISRYKDAALATTDANGNPNIRVFQIMLVNENENILYFATSDKKEVWSQIKHNPNIEILSFDKNVSVRISGRVKFDVPEMICKQIFDENEVLRRIYPRYTDLVYFAMLIKKADYYDLTPTPPVLRSYNIG